MIELAALAMVLALLTLAPLLVILRRPTPARGPQAMAIALHRTQLAELDRDRLEGRILPAEHATAVLEVQRRLLAAADRPDAAARAGSRAPLVLVAVLVPLSAVGLYLVGGQPLMPSLPPGAAAIRQQHATEEALLVTRLRERLGTLDPAAEQTRPAYIQGYTLLGTVEEARGHDAEAAEAFSAALAPTADTPFDPVLALRAADAASRAEGALSTASAALLRRVLATLPPGTPARLPIEARLKASGL